MSRADITLTVNPGRSRTARSSDRSASLTDEDSSSGTGVHLSPSSGLGSQESSDREYSEYEADSWEQLSKADVGPSDSASRPSTSNHHRIPEAALRHHSRREASHSRLPHRPSRTHPQPSSPESVGSNEDLLAGYGPDLSLRPRRPYIHWASAAGGQNHQYAPSYSTQSYGPYPTSSGMPPGQQMVPFSSQPSQYPYSPYQQQPAGNSHGYFGHGSPTGHPGVPGSVGAPMVPQTGNPYSHEMIHPVTVPAYYPYPQQPYSISHPIAPSPVYQHYQPFPTPPPAAGQTSPTAQPEAPKDDGYAELKQMLITEKAERELREAAERERIAAAEAAKAKADEIAAAAAEAAKAATTEAEKKAAAEKEEAATKAKEAADKAKAEAEEATAKLKAEAEEAAAKAKEEKEAAITAATAALAPPEEKKKPIKFKDAVGRKFSFPFHLCSTWEGMEDLIRQAFLHVDIIGPHVAEGHYDLIGPNQEIILPGVWETVIEPDWTITMHMWPMPEPKLEDPAIIEVPDTAPAPAPEKKGKNKRRVPPAATAADVPPPPPPAPLAPDGVIDAPIVPKKKQAKAPFWFSAARPRPKPKQLVKKA